MTGDIAYLYDAAGKLVAVQISADLWQRLEPLAGRVMQAAEADDLAAFAEFLETWTFPYAYRPGVVCPGCHAATEDWQKDSARPFILKNANIGGLLVFGCRSCGGTVRQKYFRSHMECEYTPG